MCGFINEQQGMITLSNRIFETLLYNYFLTKIEVQDTDIYNAGAEEKLSLAENVFFCISALSSTEREIIISKPAPEITGAWISSSTIWESAMSSN